MVGILFKLPVRAYKEIFFQAWPFFAVNWKRIKRLEFAIDRYFKLKYNWKRGDSQGLYKNTISILVEFNQVTRVFSALNRSDTSKQPSF